MSHPLRQGNSFWTTPLVSLLSNLQTTPAGLSSGQAALRLKSFGPNLLQRPRPFTTIANHLRVLWNPLVLILIASATVSLLLGEHTNGFLILAMVLLSVLLNFSMEFQARHAVEQIQHRVALLASVRRDGATRDIPVSQLVPGDILLLNAGDLVPADARLIETKDLQVRESVLTGESLPVPKNAGELPPTATSLAEATNSVFFGTAVQTGIGVAVVVSTARQSELGEIVSRLAARPPETEFARGIRNFGLMLTRLILGLVLFVLLVNWIFHRPALDSFLFAVALAVGMTPEMMPMIVTITLARGALRMSRKKVLIKQLAAIEDFGSLTILCSDKTGTLTEGEITLERHVDISGEPDARVFHLVYLNSAFQAGIKSPMDDAVLRHESTNLTGYEKADEIPFDFSRKRISVVLHHGGEVLLVTKGEAESIFQICDSVRLAGQTLPFTAALHEQATRTLEQLSALGYRTLGIASRIVPRQEVYTAKEEATMTFEGFAAFLDPPKPEVAAVLSALKENGVSVVVMTGDNPYVTRKIVQDVGLPASNIITGQQLEGMDDASIGVQAEQGAVFARVSPIDKHRILLALKARGHVVGYLGDGINDAPSLHSADVGISVQNGVDVAKDAAKVILLEKDLAVLNDGIEEGRRSFANIMKYILMGTSSNFGNMFSMAAASLFLPFLPMLPTQILLNNFLYDASQVSIPGDNVDPALLHVPKRWRIDFIRRFMLLIGPISSVYDLLTFAILWFGFSAAANPPLFRTAWFVESLATQTLVVFVIRTAGNPFASRPGHPLVFSVLTVLSAAILIPYTPLAPAIGFTPLPPLLLAAIAVLTAAYLLVVHSVKTAFYRRHALL